MAVVMNAHFRILVQTSLICTDYIPMRKVYFIIFSFRLTDRWSDFMSIYKWSKMDGEYLTI